MDEVVDELTFVGGLGLVVVVVFGREGGALGGIFPWQDFGLGVDAGFQGILAGAGLPLDGGRTGGALRIEAIGLDLFQSGRK